MLFLSADLLQRESFLAGEIKEVDPIYLTAEQVRNDAPLPLFLVPEPDDQGASGRQSVDKIWGAYYRETLRVARSGSFLSMWVGYEVAMSNALAEARAKALDLDPAEWLVVPELGADGIDFSNLVNEWSSAQTPAAGLRVLDTARWEWLNANDDWFTFSEDEVVAYGAKLMLLKRWDALSKEQAQQETEKSKTEYPR